MAATRKTNKKRSSTKSGRRRGRKRNSAAVTTARKPSSNLTARKPNRRRSTRRRTAHGRKRNTGVARSSAFRMKNPSGAQISVGGILGTVVVLGLANNVVNRFTQNQGAAASAGIKIGAGFALTKFGKKIPLIGNYTQLAGLVLIILGGQDLFNQYALPYAQKLPLVGPLLGSGAPMTPLPAQDDGMGGLAFINPNNPALAQTW